MGWIPLTSQEAVLGEGAYVAPPVVLGGHPAVRFTEAQGRDFGHVGFGGATQHLGYAKFIIRQNRNQMPLNFRIQVCLITDSKFHESIITEVK